MPPEIQNAVNLLTLESVNVTLDRLLFKQMPSLILLHTFTSYLILTKLSAILIPFALMPFLFFVEFYFVGLILFTRNSNKYFYLRMRLSSYLLFLRILELQIYIFELPITIILSPSNLLCMTLSLSITSDCLSFFLV